MAITSARKVETIANPGRHSVGGGLYLVVSPAKRKSWIYRYQLDNKRRDMGLGSYPAVSLIEAREKAAEARRQISRRTDPIMGREALRKAAEPLPKFADVAAGVIADIARQSTNDKVKYRAQLLLGNKYCGAFSTRPINEISVSDVAKLLNSVQSEKPETARKLHGALAKVFEAARVLLRDRHGISFADLPTNLKDLKALGYDPRVRNEPYPALDWNEAPAFMKYLRGREGLARRALEVAILTACREDTVAGAEWSEIDLDRLVWTIPAGRLKDQRTRMQPHRVPLSSRVVEILAEQRGLDEQWVFPGLGTDSHLAAQSLLQSLKKMNTGPGGKPKWRDPDSGKPIVVHGFRSTFRTWAEDNGFRNVAAEQALGHQVGTKVEARYRRTDILDERRRLMEAWDSFCAIGPAAKIVQFVKRQK